MGAPKSTAFTVFYGYPDHLVAEWCGVTVASARAYKAGKRTPSSQALRLFELHAAGRVLGSEWDGWGVRGAALCNPEGNELTHGQLRAYSFVWQLAREYGRTNPRADEVLQRLSAVKRVKVGAADCAAMTGSAHHQRDGGPPRGRPPAHGLVV